MKKIINTIVGMFKFIWCLIIFIPCGLGLLIFDLIFLRDPKYREFRKGLITDFISFDIYLLVEKIKEKVRKHSEE